MRLRVAILILGLALGSSARANQYSFPFTNGNVIPDANPVGLTDTRFISGIPSWQVITNLEVSLNISGGFNGDLYAYLRHEVDGQVGFAILLNRVGKDTNNRRLPSYFGYPEPGFLVTISDLAATDIHIYGTVPFETNALGQLLGTWQPDARNVNPALVVTSDPRTAFLESFFGLDPNGEWTLFLADYSGGEESILESWSLNIMTVPEPGASALAAVAAVSIAAVLPPVRRRLAQSVRAVFGNSKR